jgi:hypothetical protein
MTSRIWLTRSRTRGITERGIIEVGIIMKIEIMWDGIIEEKMEG